MDDSEEQFIFSPIGYVHSSSRHRFEAPRQGVFAHNTGTIELLPHRNFETALSDLSTVERIWIVFAFHLNHGWRAKIQPPVSCDGKKIGVFATRSPHRPNPIGISCIELVSVEKRTLHIRNFDLLDGTPVFDIKPYVPEVDAFPDSRVGWLEEAHREEWTVVFTSEAQKQIEWVRTRVGLDMENFCKVQLVLDPLNYHRKRVFPLGTDRWTIGCRAWKIDFITEKESRHITVIGIRTGYSAEKLLPGSEDPYEDKAFHREFLLYFHLIP